VLELLLPLTVGATVVMATRDEAMEGRALRSLLEEHRATVMQATPVTWRLLLEAGWMPPRACRSARLSAVNRCRRTWRSN
jgi:acyl-coenzyme A synthetase/AMP-(fatty) acid ligase